MSALSSGLLLSEDPEEERFVEVKPAWGERSLLSVLSER